MNPRHYYSPPPHALPLQFYFNVHISWEDYRRLGPNLSSWSRLNELLILGQFPLEDLKRLLILELSIARRKQVLEKLQSRISTAETKHIQSIVNNALDLTQPHHVTRKKD